MPRYFLKVQYCGKNYSGWQIQPFATTVQGEIQRCLSAILKQDTLVISAGRTDTGVHARAMWMHFDAAEINDIPLLLHRLNRFFPKDIAALDIFPVYSDAHARFDAISRTYQYHITLRKDPFAFDNSWVFYEKLQLDISVMNLAANLLLHYRDYEKVSKKHSDNKTNICRVSKASWHKISKDRLFFSITADRFLRNMVRSLVGLLVQVGLGKMPLSKFESFFCEKDVSPNHLTAPSQGLYLTEVRYPARIFHIKSTVI